MFEEEEQSRRELSTESETDSSTRELSRTNDLIEKGRIEIEECFVAEEFIDNPWSGMTTPVVNEIYRLGELGYKPSEIEILMHHEITRRTIKFCLYERKQKVQAIAPTQIQEVGPEVSDWIEVTPTLEEDQEYRRL